MTSFPTIKKANHLLRLVIGGLLFLSCYAITAQTPIQKECVLSGTVFDVQDARVVDSMVIFRNASATKSVITDQAGNYQIKIVPGNYEPLIAEGVNIRNYMRSRIQVSCNSDTDLNLYVMPECVSYGCERLGSSFDVFRKKDCAKEPELVIAYFDRRKSGDNSIYSDVVMTFHEHTVRANEVRFNRKTKKIIATNGWIESGLVRQKFDERTITVADSLLGSDFEISTISDISNSRRLRKLYSDLKRSKII